ncbi:MULTISPECIES: Rnf-Nqr domain containing protein [Helcococcus]|uniref:Rnf-Nqr domain containing protein n=1 Tax=Helcococcus bovis TaxID=3153252 RepID=A0ABW9F4U7_9FIRM
MKKSYLDNIIMNNPVLVQSLGFVSILALSNSLKPAIIMALAVTFVLVLSSLVVSLLKSFINEDHEILFLMIIVATFATIAEMTIKSIYPITYQSMGILTSLIAVNSIMLSRLQKHAITSGVVSSVIDSITTGLGYTLVIAVLAVIRELIGNGTIYGIRIIPSDFTIKTFNEPMMAFILLGLFIAFLNWYTRSRKLKEARK